MTNNQLAENSVIQLLNSVKLARDNAERADNRVDHSFYYALTIALGELQERRKADSEPYGFTDGDRRGMIYEPQYADRLNEPLPVYRHAQPAPVVPDAYVRDEHGRMMLNGVCEPKIGFGTGWNACRAAMLAAALQSPGSEPATVPGKWIPVSEQKPDCWCLTCRPVTLNDMRFVVCPDCGNKRCPRTNDHRNACARSNEPGQEGSAYPAAPQEVRGE